MKRVILALAFVGALALPAAAVAKTSPSYVGTAVYDPQLCTVLTPEQYLLLRGIFFCPEPH